MVEVLRVHFSGASLGGQEHVVTIDAGEPGERCALKVDGRIIRYRSWPRCRAVLLRRIFKAVLEIEAKAGKKEGKE